MNKSIRNKSFHSYTVRVARSIEEVEQFRNFWEKTQCHPNIDIDYYFTVIRFHNIVRPHVIALYENEVLITLLIGRIEDIRLNIGVGYKTFFNPRVRSLAIVYKGLLGDSSYQAVKVLISEVFNTLVNGEAEIAYFNGLYLDSDIYKLALSYPPILSRDHIPKTILHWKLNLPSSYTEFLGSLSRKKRQNINQNRNRITKRYDKDLSLECFSEKHRMEKVLRDSESVARKTYHRGLGVGFMDDYKTRSLYKMTFDRGWFRSYILYLKEKPIAFLNGINYLDTYYPGSTGYDSDYSYCSPGDFVFLNTIEKLCHDETIKSIDFGFGHADYKRHFCNESWEECIVYMFAPTFKWVSINLIRTFVESISRATQELMKRLKLEIRIKKIWRTRLSQTEK